MTAPDDQVRVSIAVRVPPEVAFRVFTEDIDRWWRRGPAYRTGGTAGIVHLEPRVGGALYERFDVGGVERLIETGRVIAWTPPDHLAFEWRSVTFGPDEVTRVDVRFEARGDGTFVTVTHAGWHAIRPDHPVRHGEASRAFLGRLGMWWAALLESFRATAGASPSVP